MNKLTFLNTIKVGVKKKFTADYDRPRHSRRNHDYSISS